MRRFTITTYLGVMLSIYYDFQKIDPQNPRQLIIKAKLKYFMQVNYETKLPYQQWKGRKRINRNRDSIEKAFRILKTDMDIFPMRVRKELTIRGMLFILFK